MIVRGLQPRKVLMPVLTPVLLCWVVRFQFGDSMILKRVHEFSLAEGQDTETDLPPPAGTHLPSPRPTLLWLAPNDACTDPCVAWSWLQTGAPRLG